MCGGCGPQYVPGRGCQLLWVWDAAGVGGVSACIHARTVLSGSGCPVHHASAASPAVYRACCCLTVMQRYLQRLCLFGDICASQRGWVVLWGGGQTGLSQCVGTLSAALGRCQAGRQDKLWCWACLCVYTAGHLRGCDCRTFAVVGEVKHRACETQRGVVETQGEVKCSCVLQQPLIIPSFGHSWTAGSTAVLSRVQALQQLETKDSSAR